MKTKLQISCLIILISTFFFDGCKKYDEGSYISLRSKNERIANVWRFTSYILGNTDVTNQCVNTRLTLSKGGDATFKDGSDVTLGTWNFDSQKEKITIRLSYDYESTDEWGNPTTFTCSDACNFTIIQLKEKSLHLRGTLTETDTDPTIGSITVNCEWKLAGQ
jgi:hypothetical protein